MRIKVISPNTMASMTRDVATAIGAAVMSGVDVAVKMPEIMVTLGSRTSKLGGFAPRLPKRYVGLVEGFAPKEA